MSDEPKVYFGVCDVEPHDCPLCPECGHPMWQGEALALEYCVQGGKDALARLVHLECTEDDEAVQRKDSVLQRLAKR